MYRIPPDQNDVAVWLFDEQSPPFQNSSPSSNSLGSEVNFTRVNGDISTGMLGLFTDCVSFPGMSADYQTGLTESRNGVMTKYPLSVGTSINYPITVSGWVFIRTFLTLPHPVWPNPSTLINGCVFGKLYDDDNVWAQPFFSFSICMSDFTTVEEYGYYSPSGGEHIAPRWEVNIATNGVLNRLSTRGNDPGYFNETNYSSFVNNWSHVGFTYDGQTLKMFLNGEFLKQMPVSGDIDYGYNGSYMIGSMPGVKSDIPCKIHDWRVANVVRPESYFSMVYKGFLNYI